MSDDNWMALILIACAGYVFLLACAVTWTVLVVVRRTSLKGMLALTAFWCLIPVLGRLLISLINYADSLMFD
jgi:hypothetical protein